MLGGNLIIRPATRRDLQEIFALYGELAGTYGLPANVDEREQERRWQEVSADTRQHILVGEIAGRVVGTLTVVIVPNLGHGGSPWAALDNVVVRGDCRGRGIGTALMAEAGRIARTHGCYKIVLSSNLVRRDAHSFYRRLGWQETHVGFSLMLQDKP